MSLIFNSEDNLPAEGFFPVRRVNVRNILKAENLQEAINTVSIKNGEPLVLAGFNKLDNWDSHLFTSHYLQATHGEQYINMTEQRNNSTTSTTEVPLKDLIKKIIEDSPSFMNNISVTSTTITTTTTTTSNDNFATNPISKVNGGTSQEIPNSKGKEVITAETFLYKPDKDTLNEMISKIIQDYEGKSTSVNPIHENKSRRQKFFKKLAKEKAKLHQLETGIEQDPDYFSSMSPSTPCITESVYKSEESPFTPDTIAGRVKVRRYIQALNQLNNTTVDFGGKNKNELLSSESLSMKKALTFKEKTKKDGPSYYGKDMRCPEPYIEKLKELIPNFLLSLGNDDLNRLLPKELQDNDANYVCSLDGDGSHTAIHAHTGGSIGHNLMLFGDDDAYSQWLLFSKFNNYGVYNFLRAKQNQPATTPSTSSSSTNPSSSASSPITKGKKRQLDFEDDEENNKSTTKKVCREKQADTTTTTSISTSTITTNNNNYKNDNDNNSNNNIKNDVDNNNNDNDDYTNNKNDNYNYNINNNDDDTNTLDSPSSSNKRDKKRQLNIEEDEESNESITKKVCREKQVGIPTSLSPSPTTNNNISNYEPTSSPPPYTNNIIFNYESTSPPPSTNNNNFNYESTLSLSPSTNNNVCNYESISSSSISPTNNNNISTYTNTNTGDSTATISTDRIVSTNSMSIEELREHGMAAYVTIQRPGDLLIIPSGHAYQVDNVGNSFKVAWDRKNFESLAETIVKKLPIYLSLRIPDTYRCTAAIYHALKHFIDDKNDTCITKSNEKHMKETYDGLIKLFYEILHSQSIDESLPIDDLINDCGYFDHNNESNNNNNNEISNYYYNIHDDDSDYDDYDVYDDHEPKYFIKNCDLCSTDIFNRYFNCNQCNKNVCLTCYQRRFSCGHPENLNMHQYCHKNSSHLSNIYGEAINKFNKTFEGEKAVPCEFYTGKSNEYKGERISDLHKYYSLASTCKLMQGARNGTIILD